MKYTILLIIFCLSLGACNQAKPKTNPFAQRILISKTDKHERVKGTSLYAIIPDNYEYVEELGRYQVSDNQFVQFTGISNSWIEHKKNLNREAFGVGIIIYEKVEISGLEGIYVEGVDPNSNKNDIVLCFGDDEVTIVIVAKTTEDNPSCRTELIEILKSVFLDKDYTLDELELANFTFDKSITNYSLAMSGNNMFMYAENGKEDVENTFANSILFGHLPYMSKEKLMEYVAEMIERHKSNGVDILQPEITTQKIGKFDAIILDTKTKLKGRNGLLYQVVLESEGSVLTFFGSGYDDVDILREKYIKTVESIEWK
jgi:hypothetical protein